MNQQQQLQQANSGSMVVWQDQRYGRHSESGSNTRQKPVDRGILN